MEIWFIIILIALIVIFIVRENKKNSSSVTYIPTPVSDSSFGTSYNDSVRNYRLSDELRGRLAGILEDFRKQCKYKSVPFTVKGLAYRSSEAQLYALHINVGDYIVLEPEPENPYDINAVKVLYLGQHIGYVDKKVAKILSDNPSYCTVAYVTSVSNHEVPFINAIVSVRFIDDLPDYDIEDNSSVEQIEQNKLSQLFLSVNRRENILLNFKVKGTLYRSKQEINMAFQVSKSDYLFLEPYFSQTNGLCSIKVYYQGSLIGFVDEDVLSLVKLFPDFGRVARVNYIKNGTVPFIYAELFVPVGNSLIDFPGSFSIDQWLHLLKFMPNEDKVEVFLKLSESEDGIYYAHEACMLLRLLKDYGREKELVLKTIDKCKLIGKEDYIPVYESRLAYVSRILSNREKRERGKAMRNAEKK